MRKVILLTPLLFLIIYSFVYGSTIQNNYLVVSVDDNTGRIFLSTLNGKPDVKGDEKKALLFYDNPPSSYTLIYIDDDIFTFGNEPGKMKAPVSLGKSIKTFWSYDKIDCTQAVSFVEREKNNVEDGVLISYLFENKDDRSHSVGLRILFDTYLGERGRYHFELSTGKRLNRETIISNNEIPEYWISRDKRGIVCLRGVLKDNFAIKPTKVVFANYRYLFDNITFNIRLRHVRGFDYLPYSRGDSAVAIYFGPIELKPGKKIKYSTILGLCGNGKYKISENVVKVIQPVAKKDEKKVQKKNIYYVEDYKKFIKILNEGKNLQKDLQKIDKLLETLNKELENRDKGKPYNVEVIKKIKQELGLEQ